MSLAAIVRALGGDLYAGGRRALTPAPGHSASDRSVSLLLEGDRVIVHSFGGADWREVRDDLRARGLVDAQGRLRAQAAGTAPAQRPPGAAERIAAARALWAAGAPLGANPSAAYCARRGVAPPWPGALRHHPGVPSAVYRGRGRLRPALLAAVLDPGGRLAGVELTYLTPDGRRVRTRTPRKLVGCVPSGSAVRLAPPAALFLVGEGVFTTLAAMARFRRPGWALLSTSNLRRWTPPPEVRDVLVAGDRGRDGERSARILAGRLRAMGLCATVRTPPPPFGDWDDARAAEEAEGGAGGGEPSGRVVRTGGSETDP